VRFSAKNAVFLTKLVSLHAQKNREVLPQLLTQSKFWQIFDVFKGVYFGIKLGLMVCSANMVQASAKPSCFGSFKPKPQNGTKKPRNTPKLAYFAYFLAKITH